MKKGQKDQEVSNHLPQIIGTVLSGSTVNPRRTLIKMKIENMLNAQITRIKINKLSKIKINFIHRTKCVLYSLIFIMHTQYTLIKKLYIRKNRK